MAVVQQVRTRSIEADQARTRSGPPAEEKHLGIDQVVITLALIALSILFCLPFLWLVLASLKPQNEVFSSNWIPSKWVWSNYSMVFDQAPVWRWMINSVIICVLGVVSVLLSSSLVAFSFARLKFRGKNWLFALIMGTYLLPGSVLLIPTFLIWNKLGAVNTWFPLWLPNIFGSAFYIFMLRQFMLSIPQDLVDAARVDGAGFFRIYWHIMLPLIRPALVAVAIFEFQAKWNDFFTPLIYLNSRNLYTMSLGLATFKSEFRELGNQWTLLMAGSVIFTIPMIILFFLFQRYFMESVTHTGIKG